MDLIANIRRSHGFDTQVDLAIDSPLVVLRGKLERACERLSNDLYNKKTHFLLEFIQNADDNHYPPTATPTLKVRLDAGSIMFMCNEIGFDAKNVRAICDIGQSTKAHEKKTQGYIGEKGIGFKSVFSVADVVRISSREYKFKFDRRRPLGMITPTWDETCPEAPLWTTFTLELSPKESFKNLSHQIAAIKPTLLLFLRQISSLEIDVNPSLNDDHRSRKTIVLSREITDGLTVLRRIDGSVIASTGYYLVIPTAVDTYRQESKREGITRSEITLAFPLNHGRFPLVDKTQDVHAFLPIRSYGFKFVIQADFLTSSNREDIIHDSQWNMSLLTGVSKSFLLAVEKLKHDPVLQYTWFRFIPRHVSAPFGSVERTIISSLKTEAIIRSEDGTFHRPTEFVILSGRFRGKDGRPLIPEEFLNPARKYLPEAYNTKADSDMFNLLGIQEFTNDNFLDGLARMGRAIEACTAEWHDMVSSNLLQSRHRGKKNCRTGRNIHPKILPLRILPLENGSWIEARFAEDCVFEVKKAQVPDDLGLKTVSSQVRLGTDRHKLFEQLGVRHADIQLIAAKIVESTKSLPPAALIGHAHFLYQHRCNLKATLFYKLRFASHKGTIRQSSDLYWNLPELRRILPETAEYLHPGYLRASNVQEDWGSWLSTAFQFNRAPRIVNGAPSPELLAMARSLSVQAFLGVLQTYWREWSLNSAGVAQLSDISVACMDGSVRPLKSTALSRNALAKFPLLSFLPVEKPDDNKWNFLEDLGVTVRPNAAMYVKSLLQLQGSAKKEADTILHIYKQLDARFYEDSPCIRQAFQTHPLFFVPGLSVPKNGTWHCLKDVVWDGPRSLNSKLVLRQSYPELEEFFASKLQVGNASAETLVQDVLSLSAKWQGRMIDEEAATHFSQMLVDICGIMHELDDTRSQVIFSKLTVRPIFPFKHPSSGLRIGKRDEFYVPDMSLRLAEAFSNRLPLLAVHPPSILSRLHPILRSPIWNLRHLDNFANCTPTFEGEQVLDIEATEKYLSKLEYIERLVRHCNVRYNRIELRRVSKLQEFRIFAVQGIVSVYKVGDCEVSLPDRLRIKEQEDSITLYICQRQSHLAVCGALAPLLGLDPLALRTVIQEDEEELDGWFKSKGIAEIEGDHHYQPWLQNGVASGEVDKTGALGLASKPQKKKNKSGSNAGEKSTFNHDLKKILGAGIGGQVFANSSFVYRPGAARPSSSVRRAGNSGSVNAGIGRLSPSTSSSRKAASFVGGSKHESHQATQYETENGILGEVYMYQVFGELLGTYFDKENWTSALRGHVPGLLPYTDAALADFTIDDDSGTLTKLWLGEEKMQAWTDDWPTYHIEVKATSGSQNEPFHVSSSQMQTAMSLITKGNLEDAPTDIFVLVRVAHIREKPTYEVYVDPARLLYDGHLVFSSDVELSGSK